MPRAFTDPVDTQNKINQYIETCRANDEPMTWVGLAVHLDVNKDTLNQYYNGQYDDDYEYSVTFKKARSAIESDKLSNALKGKYNATIAIFDLKNNHGYADKFEQDITSKGERVGLTPTDNEIIQRELEKRAKDADK